MSEFRLFCIGAVVGGLFSSIVAAVMDFDLIYRVLIWTQSAVFTGLCLVVCAGKKKQ